MQGNNQYFRYQSPSKYNEKVNSNSNQIFYTPDSKQATYGLHSPITEDYQKRNLFYSNINENKHSNIGLTSPPSCKSEQVTDRFIPLRMKSISRNLFGLKENNNNIAFSKIEEENEKQQNYHSMLETELLGQSQPFKKSLFNCEGSKQDEQNLISSANFLKFKTPSKPSNDFAVKNALYTTNPFTTISTNNSSAKKKRQVQKQAYKVLDAPGLIDDFYVDLLHWGKNNIISVSLSDAIYLWNVQLSKVSKLTSQNDLLNMFTSLQFSQDPNILSVGNKNGKIDLWDISKETVILSYHKQSDRIGHISWNNPNIFAAGSKDKSILIYDIRTQNQVTELTQCHMQEITGLAWSYDQVTLASGGNDNKVVIWNTQKNQVQHKFKEYKAAVRAVCWSPHQNGLLITGGGTQDQTIKILNTLNNTVTQTIDVHSQVCKILFSQNSNEFITSHGFEDNELIVWKYPELSKTAILEGHEQRVLYMSLSPCGQIVVTGAGDQMLKFWKVFPQKSEKEDSCLIKSIDLR